MARVALYSHDSTGLGHVRRNLLVAQAVAGAGHDVLLVSGSPESPVMPRPPRTDLVTLPALRKDVDGSYGSRHLRLGLAELCRLRADLAAAAVTGFAPDLLVVDRHARGFRGELEPALQGLPRRTRVVLGLRDVLDDPAAVRREWDVDGVGDALTRWYDEVWVYGDRAIHRPLDAADLVSPVPVHALGYLAADRPAGHAGEVAAPEGPYVLCTVGGGADGQQLADAFVRARCPPGVRAIVVTGPQMPLEHATRLARVASERAELTIVSSVVDVAPLVRGAAAAVVMGGYNTVSEVLASDTPALVVPRARPRLEQRLRARLLADAGLVDLLPAEQLSTAALQGWMAAAVAGPRRQRHRIDRCGLEGVSSRAAALLSHLRPTDPPVGRDPTPAPEVPTAPALVGRWAPRGTPHPTTPGAPDVAV